LDFDLLRNKQLRLNQWVQAFECVVVRSKVDRAVRSKVE